LIAPEPQSASSMSREYPAAPIVGVGAVVIEGGRVLLVRRRNPPRKGEWSLQGGALELGETLEVGAVREVFEEAGLVIETMGLVEVLDLISKEEAENRVLYHYVVVDYLCRVVGGELAAASDAEEARWVEREQLNSHGIYRLAPVTAMVIEKAFRMAAAAALAE
jgi:8-oxo-dGTP diphosphatase